MIVLACGVLLAGCSSSGGDTVPGSAAPTARAPAIDESQRGAETGQPGATVIKLWSYLRNGLLPLALNAYDPDVVARITEGNFLGALGITQSTANAFSPRIVRTVAVDRRPAVNGRGRRPTAIVYVDGRGLQGAITQAAFLLQRTPQRWEIVFDSMTEGALRSYLTERHTNAPDPKLRLPAAGAAQAASQVVRRYQQLANTLAAGYF